MASITLTLVTMGLSGWAKWIASASMALALVGSERPAEAQGADRVVLQLKWKHQFQFAGYYEALEQGYYRSAGLDVTIVEAADGLDPISQVVGGKADFGVGTTELLLHRARGEPVVVLAVIYQHSPLKLAVRTDRGIDNLHQLVGHKIMVEAGSAELFAMLAVEKISKANLLLTPHTFDTASFIRGDVDAMSVYVTNEPFAFNEAGTAYSMYSARASGIDFYGDNLFTTTSQVTGHPGRVTAFRDASLRGWRYALDHPDEAIRLIESKYGGRKSHAHLQYEADRTAELVMPRLVDVGYMHAGRWRHIADTYASLGMVPQEMPLDGFLFEPAAKKEIPQWMWVSLVGGSLFLVVVGGLSVSLLRRTNRLRSSESGLRDMLDLVPVPVVASSTDTHVIVYVNERTVECMGAGRDHLVGLPIASFHEKAAQRNDLIRDVVEKGTVVDREMALRRFDGSGFAAMVSSRMLEFEARQVLVSAFVDLASKKRRESEARATQEEVLMLRGILPICSRCKSIRTDPEARQALERYVASHPNEALASGCCPQCVREPSPSKADKDPEESGT